MSTRINQISVIKLVLETTSPMAIYTGSRETLFDNQLVRDVNGLPMIPATSFVGVWRHLAEQQGIETDRYFGTTGDNPHASTISVSSARMLNSNSIKVENYVGDEAINTDNLLRLCKMERPIHRDRVSINDRGVAKETSKFDQLLVPKGVRFALTIQIQGMLDRALHSLLGLFNDKRFALGASTRNGLGQVKVLYSELCNIELNENTNAGVQLQEALSKPCGQSNELSKPQYNENSECLLASIPLQALDLWRCGRGSELLGYKPKDGSIGIISYSEQSISWKNDNAQVVQNKPVLCGSSIKGMIAHRCAYHYRRHMEIWADDMHDATHEQWETRPEEMVELFGKAEDSDTIAGRLIVLDSDIEYQNTVVRTHNAIDRFTGGVRRSALYSEELLYQPTFTLKLYLTEGKPISPKLRKAFIDTIDDIKLGLLPIGAGSGRGTSMVLPQKGQPIRFNETLLEGQVS